MGFNFGLIKDAVVGATTGYISSGGNPAGAFTGAVSAGQANKAENAFKKQVEAYNKQIREQNMVMGSGEFGTPGLTFTPVKQTTSGGFGSGFGQFVSDVGSNIFSPLASLANNILPFFGRNATQPAITTPKINGPQETQISGTSEAFIGGGGIPALFNLGKNFLKSPVGSVITGTGAGIIGGSMFDGQPKQMRITRKMKSQARMVLNMTGGNLQAAADILGIDQNTLVFVLLKRFRNDGPVVTKAALRKTKQTVRRLKSMCDMYDDLRPRATTRRRTPVRRSTTTLIKN